MLLEEAHATARRGRIAGLKPWAIGLAVAAGLAQMLAVSIPPTRQVSKLRKRSIASNKARVRVEQTTLEATYEKTKSIKKTAELHHLTETRVQQRLRHIPKTRGRPANRR